MTATANTPPSGFGDSALACSAVSVATRKLESGLATKSSSVTSVHGQSIISPWRLTLLQRRAIRRRLVEPGVRRVAARDLVTERDQRVVERLERLDRGRVGVRGVGVVGIIAMPRACAVTVLVTSSVAMVKIVSGASATSGLMYCGLGAAEPAGVDGEGQEGVHLLWARAWPEPARGGPSGDGLVGVEGQLVEDCAVAVERELRDARDLERRSGEATGLFGAEDDVRGAGRMADARRSGSTARLSGEPDAILAARRTRYKRSAPTGR